MVTYLFPLGGLILGVTFLHEQLTWQLMTGAMLIVASLAIAIWEPRKKELPQKQQVTTS